VAVGGCSAPRVHGDPNLLAEIPQNL
jgi:hypothetical protein